jgi:hypothetical protein
LELYKILLSAKSEIQFFYKKNGLVVLEDQIYKKKLYEIKKAPQKRGASSQIYS